MSERDYQVVSLDELERYPAMSGAPVLMPLRRLLDVRAFGINCWTAPVGAPVIERHSEPDGDEEVYVVVRGGVRFTVGEEAFDAGPATLVHVLPDMLREAVATEPETLVLAVGAKPGEAFEPKSWEGFQIAFAQARARGEEEARTLLAEMLARDPGAWQPAYNAACFETLTGNTDAAFEHLVRALALGPPRVRQLAAGGEDFRGAAFGLDDMVTLPLDQSHAVEVRGNRQVDLRFTKQPNEGRPNRSSERDLVGFVTGLEGLSAAALK